MAKFEEFRWNIFIKHKPLISENCDDFRFRKIHTYVPRYMLHIVLYSPVRICIPRHIPTLKQLIPELEKFFFIPV